MLSRERKGEEAWERAGYKKDGLCVSCHAERSVSPAPATKCIPYSAKFLRHLYFVEYGL